MMDQIGSNEKDRKEYVWEIFNKLKSWFHYAGIREEVFLEIELPYDD